ncbi:Conidiation protein 6-domain-containing protein [Diplogelasinospora grovesii]|uniref:Conidiation protein 6-domain-containing protein n=1 Tax=Diplogelasinospora grovesii TaxID=303347 RepID=A0AAN6S6G0_9PEZI|nr:Conidiation protein 6-domain-containing protein [Diplogelasinospora grovesii]
MPSDAQVAGGHKANLKNPNTSKESKEHSKAVLENEYNGGDVQKSNDGEKNPGNVIGGLKATLSNPRTSDEAKESAQQRLDEMNN